MRKDQPEPLFLRRIRSKRDNTVTPDSHEVALEARVIEQEHRFVATWSNFLSRKQWQKGDPRRRAAIVALLWRFVPKAVPVTIGLSLGAVFTLLLTYKANQLIDVQNNLAEAQRRASLNIELSAIMDEINAEVKANSKVKPTDSKKGDRDKKDVKKKLHNITEVRIIALSRSLEPYRSLKTDQVNESTFTEIFSISNILDNPLNSEFLSPERGQLLVSLVGLQQREKYDVSRIFEEGDFSQARLNGASLRGAKLSRANLRGAYLREADLIGADLSFADLSGAELSGADLSYKANLKGAKLISAHLSGTDLYGANLYGADLSGADLHGANLSTAKLKAAAVVGTDLREANLRFADFTYGDGVSKLTRHEEIKDIRNAKLSKDAAEPFKSWALAHGAVLE